MNKHSSLFFHISNMLNIRINSDNHPSKFPFFPSRARFCPKFAQILPVFLTSWVSGGFAAWPHSHPFYPLPFSPKIPLYWPIYFPFRPLFHLLRPNESTDSRPSSYRLDAIKVPPRRHRAPISLTPNPITNQKQPFFSPFQAPTKC